MRRGDAIEGSLIRHEWFHHGDDLVVDPPCTSDMNNFVLRAPLEGRASDGLFALTSRRINRDDIHVYCGDPGALIARWLRSGANRLSLRAHGSDVLQGRLEHMMESFPITLHRTGCGDSAADRAE
jgi:hypothetical protein